MGGTWLGSSEEAFYNNLVVNNSQASMEVKSKYTYNDPTGWDTNCGKYDYYLTGSMLRSLSSFREGIFTARLAIPSNPNFWPAYWLRSAGPIPQEIDIFEFFPNSTGNCDLYGEMSTTIHGYYNNGTKDIACSRGAKFPESALLLTNPSAPAFQGTYHYFTCFWTEYRVQVYVDNTLVFEATKFYDKTLVPQQCHWGVTPGRLLPKDLYYCTDLNNSNKNKNISYDMYFPNPAGNMDLIISNAIAAQYRNMTLTSPSSVTYSVDYVGVWQPQDCNTDHYISTVNQFFSETVGTNFLTGQGIHIVPNSSYQYINPAPKGLNNLPDPNNLSGEPIYLLAHDYIEILGDAFFEEGTFLKAGIVNYFGYSPIQREENQSEQVDESLIQHHDFMTKLIDENTQYNESKETLLSDKPSISEMDNYSLKIFPNPASEFLEIQMEDEDYNDLSYIEIINSLGEIQRIEKTKIIELNSFPSGFYTLKFNFSFGFVLVKSFVKI
ncbi:MAG: family 16 glycosylhydrolase [Sphingobacteriaceae bacterium]|nr:family 16 glycosylhydrolase [Sphingobacteriaceae bacterium]